MRGPGSRVHHGGLVSTAPDGLGALSRRLPGCSGSAEPEACRGVLGLPGPGASEPSERTWPALWGWKVPPRVPPAQVPQLQPAEEAATGGGCSRLLQPDPACPGRGRPCRGLAALWASAWAACKANPSGCFPMGGPGASRLPIPGRALRIPGNQPSWFSGSSLPHSGRLPSAMCPSCMPGWFGNQSPGEASSSTGTPRGPPSQLAPAGTCEVPQGGKQNLDWMQGMARWGRCLQGRWGQGHRS